MTKSSVSGGEVMQRGIYQVFVCVGVCVGVGVCVCVCVLRQYLVLPSRMSHGAEAGGEEERGCLIY